MLRRGIAGAVLCIWSAFSSSVKRETRSAARRSGDRFGSRYGELPGCWATAATPAIQSTAPANRFSINLESPAFSTVSLNAGSGTWHRSSGWRRPLPEQPRREFVQVAPPSQPFVRGSGRFVIHMLDAGLGQRFVEAVNAGIHTFRFLRSNADPDQLHPFVERRRIGEHTVVGGLRIERSTHAAAGSAEPADPGKLVQVTTRDLEGLHAAHGKTCHGAMLPVSESAERAVHGRNQVMDHNLFESARGERAPGLDRKS